MCCACALRDASMNDLFCLNTYEGKSPLYYMQEYTFKISGPAFGVKSHFKPIALTFYGMTAQIVSSWLQLNAGSFAQGTSSESIGITSFRMEL